MWRWYKWIGALLLVVATILPVRAQQANVYWQCLTSGFQPFCATSAANPLPVSATASITGFPTTQSTGTPISVTTGGVTGTLPTGTVVVASNVGTTNAAYCKLGASATTSDQYIAPNGGWFSFTVGASTQLTCITSTSTTTVNMVGGSGLPTGTGGGSGGSGSGGAVTLASGAVSSGAYSSGSIASGAFASGSVASGAFASGSLAAGSHAAGAGVDGWDLSVGATTATAATAGGTGTVQAKLRLMTTQLDNINTNIQGSIPAGTAIIGAVNNPYSAYETVAASQTGQSLGATGGTGDYLSHCVVYPTSTTPGVVTVFDSTSSATNNVIAFPGGASSVSNLVPFAIPVGAISVNGAWKVTTGSNVSVNCFGKFT